ncbi:MAG TPA: transcriptional regulator NrdR [Spirochaetota bacterium]|nr:transcriptional regulator NrdR [Spirochaetota bacterium]
MKCPYCSSDTHKVVDKRESPGAGSIRRRRECLQCGKRFTTYERIEPGNIMVVKKDGTREPFDREKVLRGIMKAVEKRPVSAEQVEVMVNSVETSIRRESDKEVDSETVGNLIIKELREADKVAYIRFASVYMDFRDIEAFEKEIKKLKK